MAEERPRRTDWPSRVWPEVSAGRGPSAEAAEVGERFASAAAEEARERHRRPGERSAAERGPRLATL